MRRFFFVVLALTAAAARAGDDHHAGDDGRPIVSFDPPAEAEIPAGQPGDEIRLGLNLIRNTHARLPANAPSALNCVSCHLQDGRKQYAAPFVGLASAFPSYSPRVGRTISLTDRVNSCFERSLNGKALDPNSREMKAVLAYIAWLSRGVPDGSDVKGRGFVRLEAARVPDRRRGKGLYAVRCAKCHGLDGGGSGDPSANNPPLWGERSFNIAAGLARAGTAAAFIRLNMPKDGAGALTDEQARDVAEYVVHRPRPDFAGKNRDWPKGGKPSDARY